jgi:hypothetical protein
VQFRAVRGQAETCRNNDDTAKNACWEAYKRGRSTEIVVEAQVESASSGVIEIAHHRPEKYMELKFEVKKTCQQCEEDACSAYNMPSMLAGLSDQAKGALADALSTKKRGGKVDQAVADFERLLVDRDRDELLADFERLLVDRDRDELQFEQNDEVHDGAIGLDKLRSLHPDFTDEQFDRLLHKLKITGDKVSRDQFHKYQELARESADDFEYERLDLDGDGSLDLERLYEEYGTQVTRPQLDFLVRLVNANGNKRISRDDFQKFRDTMREYIETDSFPKDLEDLHEEVNPEHKGNGVAPIESNGDDDDLELLIPGWEPVGNSANGACRTVNGQHGSHGTYTRVRVHDIRECRNACAENKECLAVEYTVRGGNCEIHTKMPTYIKEKRGVECWAKQQEGNHPDRKGEVVMPIGSKRDDDHLKPKQKQATWQVLVKCIMDGVEVDESLCRGEKREAYTKLGCEPQEN